MLSIVWNLLAKEVEKFLFLFVDDFYLDKDAIKEAIDKKQSFNIIHNEGIVKVDFIIRKDTEIPQVRIRTKTSHTV